MSKLTAIRKQALDKMMKEALFEATVAVLGEHGVNGMTMDRVALAAGVAKGSLYRYFRGKRDLLEFAYAKIIDPIFQDMDAMLATDQSATEKLAGQLRMFLEHVAKHAQVFRLLLADDTAHGLLRPSERRSLEAASQRMAGIFRQGIAEGVFRDTEPLMLASIYLGLWKGVLEREPNLEGIEQRESVHRLIMGTLLHGIATERGQND